MLTVLMKLVALHATVILGSLEMEKYAVGYICMEIFVINKHAL